MPSRGRHPGKALLALFLASALFAAAGFVQSNAFVATGNQRTRVSLATPAASAAPLQAATNPEHPVTASRLRSLGCLLLAMGAFAARSGARPKNGFRSGPKVLVHFHPRAESKLATAALGTAYSVEPRNENVDCAVPDLNLYPSSELIDIAATASPKPMVAFGQTAQRLPGLGPRAPKSSKGRRAHQRRQHRNIGSKLCASLRYEMPSLSFDSSRVRSKIQMGLSIGASPKIPKSRNAAGSNESIESDQIMAELLFRSYNGGDHEKRQLFPLKISGAHFIGTGYKDAEGSPMMNRELGTSVAEVAAVHSTPQMGILVLPQRPGTGCAQLSLCLLTW